MTFSPHSRFYTYSKVSSPAGICQDCSHVAGLQNHLKALVKILLPSFPRLLPRERLVLEAWGWARKAILLAAPKGILMQSVQILRVWESINTRRKRLVWEKKITSESLAFSVKLQLSPSFFFLVLKQESQTNQNSLQCSQSILLVKSLYHGKLEYVPLQT